MRRFDSCLGDLDASHGGVILRLCKIALSDKPRTACFRQFLLAIPVRLGRILAFLRLCQRRVRLGNGGVRELNAIFRFLDFQCDTAVVQLSKLVAFVDRVADASLQAHDRACRLAADNDDFARFDEARRAHDIANRDLTHLSKSQRLFMKRLDARREKPVVRAAAQRGHDDGKQ